MYDRLAQFYEWEHLHFQDDLPLYSSYAQAAKGAILDAACGTGRIALPLAEAGFSVTGVDSSPEMLSIARSKAASSARAAKVRFVQSDLRRMDLGQRYGMALIALGSFQHMLTMDDQRQCLQRLSALLVAGGLLVIDLINPSPEWITAGDGALVHQRTAPYPHQEDRDQLSKYVARISDFGAQKDHLTLVYDLVAADGTLKRFNIVMELRFIFRYEAELLLAEAGFRLRAVFGDYSLENYQASSSRMILVAEKK